MKTHTVDDCPIGHSALDNSETRAGAARLLRMLKSHVARIANETLEARYRNLSHGSGAII